MMLLRLVNTAGASVATISEHEVETMSAARALVDQHAASNGMTKVKLVDGHDGDGARFTATTPGGRAGRNIAFLDY